MELDPHMKILLVEDGATMRKMEMKILRQLGFDRIAEAVNGNDAIRVLQEDGDIALVISDWNMPEKDGYELVTWMRQDERCRDIPFIMATGQGDKQYLAKAAEGGAQAVVTKPFSPDELRAKIGGIFGAAEEAAPAAPALGAQAPQRTADGRAVLKVAHIQITDHLTLGVMKHMIERGMAAPRCFGLETVCMPNWNLLQDALEKNTVDAAFILAPAAMDLYNYGVPLRLIMFAHRNGSIMVRTKSAEYRKPYQQFFKHKTLYIPYKMSVHHMLAHKYFSEMGLKPGMQSGREAINLRFDVVAPVNMPEFLAESPDACGFMVAEPIGSRAIAAGIAERHLLSSEIWENQPCCVVVFRKECLDRHTDAVHEFSDLLVKAGLFISDRPDESAQIAVSFLDPQGKIGLQVPVLKKVLTDPLGITTTDLYPSIADLDAIQRYMVEKMNIGQMTDLETFVDLRFADAACPARMALSDAAPAAAATDGAGREGDAPDRETGRQARRADLFAAATGRIVREGKYLVFVLAGERYGIPVLDVREITQMMPFRSIPKVPPYVKGVINLRDKVIPVIDMRAKFGIAPVPYTDRMCIIIVNVASYAGSTQIGIVMDEVLEVADIREEWIQDTPDFGADFRYDSIIGIARMQDKVITLLDIERAMGTQAVPAAAAAH